MSLPPVSLRFRRSWLCPEPHHRARFVDMQRRLDRTQLLHIGAMVLLLAPGIVLVYPAPAVVVAFAGVGVTLLLQRISLRADRPELPFFVSLIVIEATFVTAALLASRINEPDITIVVWPVAVAYARLPRAAGTLLAAATGVAVAAAKLLTTPDTVAAEPLSLILPVGAVIAISVFSAVVRQVEVSARREAVLDHLTGLLNRTALRTRAAELEQRSTVARAPISVVAADVDHFKQVNDRHGHATGDDVLREIAMLLRQTVGRRGSVYRLGGEEFVVLLPDCDGASARALSEELRTRVAAQPVAGVPVTMSFGVDSGGADRPFVWHETLRGADAALYAAKGEGRDRVRVAAAA